MIAAMLAAFVSVPHHLTIDRPAGATMTRTLAGRALMTSGWRLMWDGAAAGPGNDIVRFTIRTRPTDGIGVVDEMVQAGVGGPGSARDCLTWGLRGGDGKPLTDRIIAGRRWKAWANADAGMSQQVQAIDLRTVHRNRCYAVTRISYAVKAMAAAPGLPPRSQGAAAIDRAVASLRLS
jgi:hypothetical protein